MSSLPQKYSMLHEITVGATSTKRATYEEESNEFLEEASALAEM
jgi:hypothetical protein